jgi:hypothetical protein
MSRSNFVCVDSARIEESIYRALPGGQTVLDAASGIFITTDRVGNLDMTVPCVEAVGFINVADVAEHTIDSTEVDVTHRIRFHGGGTAQIVFRLDGSFASFRGKAIRAESRGTLLLVGQVADLRDCVDKIDTS